MVKAEEYVKMAQLVMIIRQPINYQTAVSILKIYIHLCFETHIRTWTMYVFALYWRYLDVNIRLKPMLVQLLVRSPTNQQSRNKLEALSGHCPCFHPTLPSLLYLKYCPLHGKF